MFTVWHIQFKRPNRDGQRNSELERCFLSVSFFSFGFLAEASATPEVGFLLESRNSFQWYSLLEDVQARCSAAQTDAKEKGGGNHLQLAHSVLMVECLEKLI